MTPAEYEAARSQLNVDLFVNPDFTLLPFGDTAIYSGIALMEKHGINSTDASLLYLYLRLVRSVLPEEDITFVAGLKSAL